MSWVEIERCFAHQQTPLQHGLVHRTEPLRGPNLLLFNGEKYMPILALKTEAVLDLDTLEACG